MVQSDNNSFSNIYLEDIIINQDIKRQYFERNNEELKYLRNTEISEVEFCSNNSTVPLSEILFYLVYLDIDLKLFMNYKMLSFFDHQISSLQLTSDLFQFVIYFSGYLNREIADDISDRNNYNKVFFNGDIFNKLIEFLETEICELQGDRRTLFLYNSLQSLMRMMNIKSSCNKNNKQLDERIFNYIISKCIKNKAQDKFKRDENENSKIIKNYNELKMLYSTVVEFRHRDILISADFINNLIKETQVKKNQVIATHQLLLELNRIYKESNEYYKDRFDRNNKDILNHKVDNEHNNCNIRIGDTFEENLSQDNSQDEE